MVSRAYQSIWRQCRIPAALMVCCTSQHLQMEEEKINKDELELRFVQIVFRHGARAPLTEKYGVHEHKWQYCSPAYEPVPVDVKGLGGATAPPSSSDQRQRSVQFDGGCHMGELTSVGQLQALHLGRYLRQQYVDLHGIIPGQYDPKAISVRSTNFSRTLATATGVLSGLYPDTDKPIRIETATDSEEWIYPNHRHCQRLQHLISKQYKKMQSSDKHVELEGRLKEAIGVDKDQKLSWTALHDVCHSLKVHSDTFPGQMDEKLMKELEAVAVEIMNRYVIGDNYEEEHEHIALSIGKVVQDLMYGMANAASGKRKHERMQLYSGHDTTLMPLLATLGVPLKGKWPPFMSNIIFELYWSKENNLHYVRALFNGNVIPLGSNEDGFIEFSRFYNGLEKYNLVDFSARCMTTKTAVKGTPKGSGDSIGRE